MEKQSPSSLWKDGIQKLVKEWGTPIILVDMDNTLVNWEQQFERFMAAYHPHIELVPQADRKKFQIILPAAEFWLSMEPNEGAIDAMRQMESLGLAVQIVTVPDSRHTARSASEKILWVEKHLGAKWKAQTILVSDKTLVIGDILIDDRPLASKGRLSPSWTHIHFAQPYNGELLPRLEGWDHWGDVVLDVLSARRNRGIPAAIHRAAAWTDDKNS